MRHHLVGPQQRDTVITGTYDEGPCQLIGIIPQRSVSGSDAGDSVTLSLTWNFGSASFNGCLNAAGDTISGALGDIGVVLVRD